MRDEERRRSRPRPRRAGLRYACWARSRCSIVITLLTALPDAPLRNPVTGDIIGDSPFMDSLIVIIMLFFFVAGLAYGRGAGTIKGSEDVIASITKSWAGLASLLFLFLLIAQFIAYFNFSNMAEVVAVKLGDVLEDMNIGAVWLLIGFDHRLDGRRPDDPGRRSRSGRSSRRSSSRSSSASASRRRPCSRPTGSATRRSTSSRR